MSLRERHAVVSDLNMRWLEGGGEGIPVVLVHGIPTSPELWRHVMPRIRGARVMAWEMVGYGEGMGDGTPREISVARQARYLEMWLAHLRIESAVLGGHDIGGGVAQILAVRRPDLAAALVLANAVGYDAWPVAGVRALRAAGALVRRLPPRWIAAGLRAFFALAHDDPRIASESADIHLARYARAGGAKALVRQARSLDVRDTLAIEAALPRLDLPAAVAWGDADPFLEVAYGERLARDLGAPLHRISGGRHFTPEDHPEAVAAAVNQVVARAA